MGLSRVLIPATIAPVPAIGLAFPYYANPVSQPSTHPAKFPTQSCVAVLYIVPHSFVAFGIGFPVSVGNPNDPKCNEYDFK